MAMSTCFLGPINAIVQLPLSASSRWPMTSTSRLERVCKSELTQHFIIPFLGTCCSTFFFIIIINILLSHDKVSNQYFVLFCKKNAKCKYLKLNIVRLYSEYIFFSYPTKFLIIILKKIKKNKCDSRFVQNIRVIYILFYSIRILYIMII